MPKEGAAMSEQLKRLVDEQNRTWSRMQEIQRAAEDEGRDWTAEERTNWDAAEKRLTEVSQDIERLNRAADLEKVDYRQVVDARIPESERPTETDEARSKAYDEAFYAYMRRGMGELPSEQQQLLRTGFVKNEERAQGSATGSAGGFLVPEGFRATITESMKAFGGLMNLANVITTSTGNPLPWPTNDDTGNVGALLAENTQIGEQDATLGENELGAYTFTSKLVRVSWQLLDDSAFDLPTFLARKLGERIGRAQAPYLVSGTGTSQPTGLVTNATAGVTGAVSATAAITYDNLIDLEHSVDPAYRRLQ
jgi:HK97 family phage major capsid protein